MLPIRKALLNVLKMTSLVMAIVACSYVRKLLLLLDPFHHTPLVIGHSSLFHFRLLLLLVQLLLLNLWCCRSACMHRGSSLSCGVSILLPRPLQVITFEHHAYEELLVLPRLVLWEVGCRLLCWRARLIKQVWEGVFNDCIVCSLLAKDKLVLRHRRETTSSSGATITKLDNKTKQTNRERKQDEH